MKRSIVALAASAWFAALLGSAPAHAAFATFVSGAGNDGNDCLTPATACRELGGAGGAINKTDALGIIHVLAGEYGTFLVDKSLEIVADGGQASNFNSFVFIAGTIAGIGVNLDAGEYARIRGFNIGAKNGIGIFGGGAVHIENCSLTADVTGGAGYSILYQPTGQGELYVTDTSLLSDLSAATVGGGMLIKPTGSGSAQVVLDNVSVADNSLGILTDGRATTGTNIVTIRNSVVAGGTAYGVAFVDAGGGSTKGVVESSTITGNATQGVGAYGANVTVRVKGSTISGNGQGLERSGAQVISNGGNAVADNTFNGTFSSTVAQQ